MSQNQDNFEEVGGASNNPQWKPQDVKNFANPAYPKEIVGYYISTSERVGPNGSFNVAVIARIDPATKEIKLFDVSGGSVLDKKLDEITLNSYIKIVYEGKAQSKTPGRTYNIWKTFVDKNAVPYDKVSGAVVAPPVVNPPATKANPVAQATSSAAAIDFNEDLPF